MLMPADILKSKPSRLLFYMSEIYVECQAVFMEYMTFHRPHNEFINLNNTNN